VAKTRERECQRENGWVKFLRVIVYVLSISSTAIGASLIKTGSLSAAYANGTCAAKIQNGEIIFFSSLLILCANIVWGILRWFLRGYREHWRAGRIVGKLIGGGIWRALVIIPLVLISVLFIAPQISNIISSNVLAENIPLVSLSWNYDELEYINQNIESLNLSEIESKLSSLMFNNIDFGIDASQNIAHHNSIFVNNVSAYSSTVTILNKAKLSSGSHFVVFYTDTGDDRISDDVATKLTTILEEIVQGYKNNLGLNYEYEKLPNNYTKLKKMQEVLKNSGIDEDIIDQAMPVYVVDPYKDGSSILASYAGRRFKDLGANILIKLGDLFGDEMAKLYNSTPSYPFINIRPQNVESNSLAIATAHELGHHYMQIYSYNTYNHTGSDDNFIDETTPDWMAINVLPPYQPTDNLINGNHYNYAYLGKEMVGTKYKIDEATPDFLGYPAVAFLENYYEIVPNAQKIILDATHFGDALNYLHEKAGADNYQKVMVSLAEKNLTGDYGGKLINLTIPQGETLACNNACERFYPIEPSSTRYLYFATSEYKNTYIGFSGNNFVHSSLLGLKFDGTYEIINSNEEKIEYLISDEVIQKYGMLAFAVSNSSITDDHSIYRIKIMAKELDDLIVAAGKFDFSNLLTGLEAGCYEINTDVIFNDLLSIVNLGSNLSSVLGLFGEDNAPSLQTEYEKNSIKAKENILETKNSLSLYKITACSNYIKSGNNFDVVKKRLRATTNNSLNIFDGMDGPDRFSVFVSFDLFTKKGNIYALGEHNGEMGLITITVSER